MNGIDSFAIYVKIASLLLILIFIFICFIFCILPFICAYMFARKFKKRFSKILCFVVASLIATGFFIIRLLPTQIYLVGIFIIAALFSLLIFLIEKEKEKRVSEKEFQQLLKEQQRVKDKKK